MLFELVTGRRPFESDTPYSIAVMHVTMPPPSPRQFEPNVSAALEKVILRALRKTADDRYGSAGELAEALGRSLDGENSANKDHAAREAASDLERLPKESVTAPMTAAAPVPLAARSTTSDTSPAASWLPGRQQAPGRRRRDMWMAMAAGGILGCALLVAVLILALPLLGLLTRDDGAPATATAVSLLDVAESATAAARVTAGMTATAEREDEDDPLRMTLSALAAAADATFTAEAIIHEARPTATPPDIQPVGVRDRPSLNPALQSVDGELVFFAKRDSGDEDEPVFEIVTLDLASWEMRRFNAGRGSSAYPMPSPDGRWIAFQSDRDDDFEIYLVNRLGGQLMQMTRNTVWDRLAAWSPAGDWIIYSTDTRGDQTFDLYRIRPNGGEAQPVYGDGWRNSHPRFSPDGQYIVFTSGPAVRDASTWEIRLYDRGTGETRLLTDNDARDASPSFSPDSQRILYVTTIGGARGLASMNLKGEDRRLLYTGPGSVWSASYSPDGKFIVVTSTVSGDDQLFLMDAAGGNLQQITSAGGAYASWIPGIVDA